MSDDKVVQFKPAPVVPLDLPTTPLVEYYLRRAAECRQRAAFFEARAAAARKAGK